MAGKVKFERKVFRDLIREAIYDAIASGELQPGDRIIEMEWAERFGSSQAPVREAIRDLEGSGVVETIPFKGAVVRTITVEQLDEIHAVRAGLEAVALTKVIKEVSDEDIERLHTILQEMIEAAKDVNTERFLDKDIEFHECIVELADMEELKKLWNMCNIRLWTSYSTKYSKKDLVSLAKNHEAIYRKVADRDTEQILETVLNHFSIVSEGLKG